MPEFIQHGLTVSFIIQDDTAGTFMDNGAPDPWFFLQPRLQKIGLWNRHPLLLQLQADAPLAFMQYGRVHKFLLHEKREPPVRLPGINHSSSFSRLAAAASSASFAASSSFSSLAEARMSEAFSCTVVTDCITESFMRRPAAVAWT